VARGEQRPAKVLQAEGTLGRCSLFPALAFGWRVGALAEGAFDGRVGIEGGGVGCSPVCVGSALG
jgi:hypothetical protein